MKDNIGILLGLLVTILVLITLAFYILNVGTIEFTELTSLAIVIILVLAATYIIWDRAKNVRKGLPAKDERLKNINYKAGYYGFIAALFSPFVGQFIADIILGHELDGSQVTAVVIIVSGFVFITSYLYLARKGN
jgi:C4-dicarboxylate transporter